MLSLKTFLRIIKIFFIVGIVLTIGILVFFNVSTRVTDNLDSYIYDLPFQKGASFRVVQGYGGLFTHRYTAALDFNMPTGTPVYAARGGVIYSYKDDSNE